MRAATLASVGLALALGASPAARAGIGCDCGDGDGIWDASDNCVLVPNPTQCDHDGDGYGNHCDGDFNNDGSVDGADFNPIFLDDFVAGTQTGTIGTDMNCDGAVDGADFNPLFLDQFTEGAPGPSN